jgi:hypothetical protein
MRTTHRSLRTLGALVAAALVALASVAPAAAAAPSPVHIVSPMHFNEGAFNTGTFVATGAAVDDGSLCPSGVVEDYHILLAGGQSNRKLQIPVRKAFTCDDGSGTFFVKIQVHLEFETSTEFFSWVVLGGTDGYARFRGSGRGSTVSDGSEPQTGNINTYDGFVID